MTDHRAALRAALTLPDAERPEAVAGALREFLVSSGLSSNEAATVLACMGYKPPRLNLVTLYQSVAWAEMIHRDSGTLKRGTLTALYAHFADVWADYTGRPYSPDDFRSAYRAWVRKTGGGILRHTRVGYEPKK